MSVLHISYSGRLGAVERSISMGMEGVRMQPSDKLVLTPGAIFFLGFETERLEWALATVTNPVQLAGYLSIFRTLEQFTGFEDIGKEASNWYNFLVAKGQQQVVEPISVNQLRTARIRWETLVKKRIGALYLITPQSVLDPKKLMTGISSMLSQSDTLGLALIERLALEEACQCLLVGSFTAAEFSALRAAESLLRRWYEGKTGTKMETGWGQVLDKLIEKYPEKQRPKEIMVLGYLKIRRDEVAHPDRVSSSIDAEATLLTVCSLVTNLVAELSKLLPNDQLALQSGLDSNEPKPS